MTSLSEQLSAVRQSQWEAQLDMLRTLSTRALDSAEQLIALNMKTSRASVEQAAGTLKQMLEANNPRDLYALGSSAQGQWQAMLAYSRELLGIASGARTLSWSTQPAPIRLLPAPAARLLPNLPSSVPQALEQVSIATASATSINSEIAAAAADSGTALAEAALEAGTDTLQRAADAIEAATPLQAQDAPAAPVPAVTELDAETTGADPSETPQPETTPAPADAAPAPKENDSAASAESETALEITVAPEAIVDAIVDQAIGDDAPPVKATPMAEALNGIAPEPVSARHPIASTVPLENGGVMSGGAVELPVVEPVDAAPPAPQAPERRRAPRASRKK